MLDMADVSGVIDAGGLAQPYVPMPDAEAEETAARLFGVRGTVRRFAAEKDDTFRLDADDGRRFILKAANPAEDFGELDLQTKLLRHIECTAPDLPVPRVLAAQDGEDIPTVMDAAGQRRYVRLLSYLDGIPLDTTDANATQREHIGELLAKLRFATAGFSHPASGRVLAWDVKNLRGLWHLLDAVDDEVKRARLEEAFGRFLRIEPLISGLRAQVLHNDFSRSNLVVDHAAKNFVTGIIDFGDTVHTAIAIDVSTALLNQLPRQYDPASGKDLFAEARDVLRGYLRFADLTPEELELLPHLVMARLVARALISLWRARVFPENATYILRNTEQGWAQLDWFLAFPFDEITEKLRTAR